PGGMRFLKWEFRLLPTLIFVVSRSSGPRLRRSWGSKAVDAWNFHCCQPHEFEAFTYCQRHTAVSSWLRAETIPLRHAKLSPVPRSIETSRATLKATSLCRTFRRDARVIARPEQARLAFDDCLKRR